MLRDGNGKEKEPMTNCEVINAFGTARLESEVYDNLSLAARLASAVKSGTSRIRVALWLRDFDRKLINFLEGFHAIMEGRKAAPASKADDEPPTPQRIRTTADNIEHMYRIIDTIYESARRARLTNFSLTAGSLQSLKHNSEELLDIAEWLETFVDPKHYNAAFERAEREKEAGELYDLSHV